MTNIQLCPSYKVLTNIPERFHKKKRIQKKYIKLYGYKTKDSYVIEGEKIILMGNYLYMNRNTYAMLKDSITSLSESHEVRFNYN